MMRGIRRARTSRALLLAALPFASAAGQGAPPTASEPGGRATALSHYNLRAAPAWRAELPKALSEVSGLAFASPESLLAHGDERAVVWHYDVARRRAVGRFGLGDRRGVFRGDFEDIAVVGERIFLVTGAGEIYEGRAVGDGRVGRALRRTRGLGGGCEVEGLAWDQGTRALLLLCKQARTRLWKDRLVILAVSTETWRVERVPRILADRRALERATGKRGFAGSGMVRHPRTGTLLVISGPEQTYVELSPAGHVLGGGRLDRDRHRQPEGIAIAPDLTLLIADEAGGHKATITAYAYHP